MTGTDLIQQLKSRFLGRYVDYDGVDGFQCTDLGKEGLTEATGQRFGQMGNAIDWWNKPQLQLKNVATPLSTTAAQAGDIVIKRPNHVGFATGATSPTQVEILEQNGHSGDGKKEPGNEVRTRFINRSDIAGLWRINALHTTNAAPTPGTSSMVGKTVHLSARVSSWRVYAPGTRTVKGTLNPARYGGLSYKIVAIDSLPNRALIDSPTYGRVSLPIDGDATIN